MEYDCALPLGIVQVSILIPPLTILLWKVDTFELCHCFYIRSLAQCIQVIVQLTCTMMPQPRHWGLFPCLNHYILLCSWGVFSYTLGCMRFLEYMGFVLAVFPLKYHSL